MCCWVHTGSRSGAKRLPFAARMHQWCLFYLVASKWRNIATRKLIHICLREALKCSLRDPQAIENKTCSLNMQMQQVSFPFEKTIACFFSEPLGAATHATVVSFSAERTTATLSKQRKLPDFPLRAPPRCRCRLMLREHRQKRRERRSKRRVAALTDLMDRTVMVLFSGLTAPRSVLLEHEVAAPLARWEIC